MNPGLYGLPSGGSCLESDEYAIPAGNSAFDIAHAFGVPPTAVRIALVCKQAELGYVAGDEVDAINAAPAGYSQPAFQATCTGSVVTILRYRPETTALPNKTTGSPYAAITHSKWRLKIYATNCRNA
jgi:hypothetical protein